MEWVLIRSDCQNYRQLVDHLPDRHTCHRHEKYLAYENTLLRAENLELKTQVHALQKASGRREGTDAAAAAPRPNATASFHKFAQLPPEIRREVWRLCLEPRVLVLQPAPHPLFWGVAKCYRVNRLAPPRISRVCREARATAGETTYFVTDEPAPGAGDSPRTAQFRRDLALSPAFHTRALTAFDPSRDTLILDLYGDYASHLGWRALRVAVTDIGIHYQARPSGTTLTEANFFRDIFGRSLRRIYLLPARPDLPAPPGSALDAALFGDSSGADDDHSGGVPLVPLADQADYDASMERLAKCEPHADDASTLAFREAAELVFSGRERQIRAFVATWLRHERLYVGEQAQLDLLGWAASAFAGGDLDLGHLRPGVAASELDPKIAEILAALPELVPALLVERQGDESRRGCIRTGTGRAVEAIRNLAAKGGSTLAADIDGRAW